MIARLLCRLFGHRWSHWTHLHGHVEHRDCLRCQEYEVRRTTGTLSEDGAFFYGPLFSAWEPVGPQSPVDPLKRVLDRLFPHVETMTCHRDTGETWPLAHGIGHVWEIIVDLPPSMFPHVPTHGQTGHVFREAYIPDDTGARGTVDLALTRVFEKIALVACDEVRRAAEDPRA